MRVGMMVFGRASAGALVLMLAGCKGETAPREATSVPEPGARAVAEPGAPKTGEPAVAPDLTGGKDVLAEMKKRNSDDYASPPSKFQ